MESKEKYFSLTDSLKFGFETIFKYFGFIATVVSLSTVLYVGMPFLIGLVTFFPVFPKIKKFLEALNAERLNGWTFSDAARYELIKKTLLSWDVILAMVIFSILTFLFYQFIRLGYNKIELDLYDHKPNKLAEFFSQGHLIARAAGGTLLYALGTFLGLMLFFIPGIIFSIVYGFYQLVMIDENVGIIEAFKRSARITYGARATLFALALVISLIYSITAQVFFPALFVVGPALSLAMKYAYRKLKEQTDR